MASTPAQIARYWFDEVWNKRNDALIYELIDEKAIGHNANGHTTGPAEFHEAWKGFTGLLPNIHVEVEDVIEQGENVVVRWHLTGTHGGHAFGLAPSEEPVAHRGMTWMRVRDGKLIEGWDCWNEGGLFTQLQTACAARANR